MQGLKRSAWVLLTLVPLGLGSGPAFLYAHNRSGLASLFRSGLAYLVLAWLTVAAIALIGEVDEDSVWRNVAAISSVAVWFVSVVHAFRVRKRVVEAIERRDVTGEEDHSKAHWAQRPFSRRVLFPAMGLGCLVVAGICAYGAVRSAVDLLSYLRAPACRGGHVRACVQAVEGFIVRVYSEYNSRSADDSFVVLSLPSGTRTSEVAFTADYERLVGTSIEVNVSMWDGDPIEISNDVVAFPTTLHPGFATYRDAANAFILASFGLMSLIAAATLEAKSGEREAQMVRLVRPRLKISGDPATSDQIFHLVPRTFARLMLPAMLFACALLFSKLVFKAGPQVTLIAMGIAALLALPLVLRGSITLRFRGDGLNYRSAGIDALLRSWDVTEYELQGSARGVLLVGDGNVEVSWWAKPYWIASSALGENPQQVLPLDLSLMHGEKVRELRRLLEAGSIQAAQSQYEAGTQ